MSVCVGVLAADGSGAVLVTDSMRTLLDGDQEVGRWIERTPAKLHQLPGGWLARSTGLTQNEEIVATATTMFVRRVWKDHEVRRFHNRPEVEVWPVQPGRTAVIGMAVANGWQPQWSTPCQSLSDARRHALAIAGDWCDSGAATSSSWPLHAIAITATGVAEYSLKEALCPT